MTNRDNKEKKYIHMWNQGNSKYYVMGERHIYHKKKERKRKT